MSQKENHTTASGRTAKQVIEARLEEAGISPTAVDVNNGTKVCQQHDTRKPPTEWTGNYAVYPTAADTLVVLDVDDYRDLGDGHEGVAALDGLPETLTEETPHGGEHRFFEVPVTDDGRFPAAVFDDAFGSPNVNADWGEVQVAGKYVVASPSELSDCGKDWHDCTEAGEGAYEIVNDVEIAEVSAETMKQVLLADPNITETTPQVQRTSSDSREDIDLSVHDVVPASQYPEEQRTAHPVHGSSTGTNFMVDNGAETWVCWRHGKQSCTGNALHLIGMQAGVIDCGDWTTGGLDSGTWAEIFTAARERGYDVGTPPEKYDPTPTMDAVTDAVDEQGVETDGGVDEDEATIEERVNQRVLIPFDPPSESEVEEITKKTAVDRVARIFDDHWAFVKPSEGVAHWRSVLHVFDESKGVYQPRGEEHVMREAERLLGDFVDNRVTNEIVGKLERRNLMRRVELDEPHPGRLVVGNGVLDLRTGELDDYSTDEYHRSRIDVDYDPDAECPEIDSFLHDIVDPSNVPTMYRLVAHTLYKDYEMAQKAGILVGDGQNGKSVFLSVLEEFLGGKNVSGQSLQDLEQNRFAEQNLHGKMANVHSDLPMQDMDDLGTFKKLTGDDRVEADVKYEQPIRFYNHATVLFAANGVPQMPEDNQATWRRWVYVNFPHTFDGDSQVPKRVLMRDLTAEEELQGLLAKCCEEVQAWWDGRDWFPAAPDASETREMMMRAANPVYDFAHSCLEVTEEGDDVVTKDQVREAYRVYASEEDLPMMQPNVLGERLTTIRDLDIQSSQSRMATDGRGRDTVYRGVRLTPRGRQVLGLDVDPAHQQLDDDHDYDDDPDDPNADASDGSESDSSSFEGSESESESDVESGDESDTTTSENTDGGQPAYTGQQYTAAMDYLVAHQLQDGSVPDWVCGASLYEDCPGAFDGLDVAESTWEAVEESLGMADTGGDPGDA